MTRFCAMVLEIQNIYDAYGQISSLKANCEKTKFLAVNFDFSDEELDLLVQGGFKRENLVAEDRKRCHFKGCINYDTENPCRIVISFLFFFHLFIKKYYSYYVLQ